MVIFLIVLASVILAAVLYIAIVSNVLTVKKEELFFSSLPDSADGLKILLISDIHDREMNKKLIKKIKKLSPDIIALVGDIHNRERKRVPFFRLARRLSRLCPVYYVRGNHDPFISDKRYYERLKECGVKVLEDDCDSLFGIKVYGSGFNCPIPEFDDGFSVHLCHSPLDYDSFEKKADLTLSGHVHGGLIELPFVGGLLKPWEGQSFSHLFRKDAYFPKYYKGVYRFGQKALVVSRGVGFSGVPFRFIPAEITLITLNKRI